MSIIWWILIKYDVCSIWFLFSLFFRHFSFFLFCFFLAAYLFNVQLCVCMYFIYSWFIQLQWQNSKITKQNDNDDEMKWMYNKPTGRRTFFDFDDVHHYQTTFYTKFFFHFFVQLHFQTMMMMMVAIHRYFSLIMMFYIKQYHLEFRWKNLYQFLLFFC